MEKLYNARVIVFGIGGVGSYVVEALVRSGIGAIDIVDDEKICVTNLNRQGSRKKQTPGSNAFVPSVAGMLIAAEVIKDLTQFHVTNLFRE